MYEKLCSIFFPKLRQCNLYKIISLISLSYSVLEKHRKFQSDWLNCNGDIFSQKRKIQRFGKSALKFLYLKQSVYDINMECT